MASFAEKETAWPGTNARGWQASTAATTSTIRLVTEAPLVAKNYAQQSKTNTTSTGDDPFRIILSVAMEMRRSIANVLTHGAHYQRLEIHGLRM